MSIHNDLSDTRELPMPRASLSGSGADRLPPDVPVRRAPQPQRPKKKRRRPRGREKANWFGRILVLLGIIAALLFVLYSALSICAVRQLKLEETDPRNVTSTVAEADSEVRNILLIGTDSRGDERGRADTIILLSVSSRNHTVTLTSLLRDSYVSIPNHGTGRLNAAYSYGGATLLMDTIVNNFNIPVDSYACIGFKGFVHLADALGGVEITVSAREAEAVNEMLRGEINGIMGDSEDSDYLGGAGTYTLNGKQALAYSRIRYVGDADFERTERQRTVLTGLIGKAGSAGISGMTAIYEQVLPEISTNLTGAKLYGLSLTMPLTLMRSKLQTLRLPADGTFTDQTVDGAMVLAVDFDANLRRYRAAVGLDEEAAS